jgi:hypothetical protein
LNSSSSLSSNPGDDETYLNAVFPTQTLKHQTKAVAPMDVCNEQIVSTGKRCGILNTDVVSIEHEPSYNTINIKDCKALLKKVVIGRPVTALKQQKSKGKGEKKAIAELVHLTKPITRSPDSSSSSNNNENNNILLFSCFALATAVPKGT